MPFKNLVGKMKCAYEFEFIYFKTTQREIKQPEQYKTIKLDFKLGFLV